MTIPEAIQAPHSSSLWSTCTADVTNAKQVSFQLYKTVPAAHIEALAVLINFYIDNNKRIFLNIISYFHTESPFFLPCTRCGLHYSKT
jgi:hypothetical protein